MNYENYLYNYYHRYFTQTLPAYREEVTDAGERGLAERINYSNVGAEIYRGVLGYLEGEAGPFLEAQGARLYQLALHVDVMAQVAHLHMETRAHAEAEVARRVQAYLDSGRDTTFVGLLRSNYNRDTHTFLYYDAARFDLPSLNPAQRIQDLNCMDLVDLHVQYRLVRTVDQIIHRNILAQDHPARIPREPEVWIGITTHEAWFDLMVPVGRDSTSTAW